ncbi:MAG: NAD(P)-dependent oxidoreductase [Desulfobacca sp.]|nr:NAD(P)-dependent oxidoreductase [Desulfobacca sp.]
MKVAFFNLEGWEPEVYQQTFKGHNVEVLQHPYLKEGITVDKAATVAGAEILSIGAMSRVNQAVLAALPQLKLIATRCTGFDHIDVGFAKEKGIAVSNVPVYGENTVAEYTFALILALARRLTIMFARSQRGRLNRTDLRGMDLASSTLGVIGTGRIGAHVVKIASGFDMRILCYDTYQKQELVERYGVRYLSLEELLRGSDIITLHVPYCPATHHLINRDNIGLVKKEALLVNAARGPITDTSALLWALENDLLGGLALDSFEGELLWLKETELVHGHAEFSPQEYRLAFESFYLERFPNVILSPHNAFNTVQAVQRILTTNLETILTFIEKGQVCNQVN